MMAGACVILALINVRIAFGDIQRAPHIFFACTALAIAGISGFELALMRTTDLQRYESLLRLAVVPIFIMVASVIGFIWSLFGTGRKWLALLALIPNAAAQIANLVSSVPAVRHAVALHQVRTFGGVWFTVPTIVNGPWDIVEMTSVAATVVFVADASITLWKKGGRRRALIVGGSVVLFFLAARGHAIGR